MGLKRVPPGNRLKGRQNKRFNIFDGKDYVFQESEWQLVTLLQLFWRYGLTYFRCLLLVALICILLAHYISIEAPMQTMCAAASQAVPIKHCKHCENATLSGI